MLEKQRSDDGFERIEKELKTDPARSDKAISVITGMSKASVYRTRCRMEFNKEIPIIPIDQRIALNGRKMGVKNSGYAGGPRIEIPEGESLVDVVMAGIKLEDMGKSPEEAAFAIGIGKASYREARTIVRLSQWEGLTKEDKELVQQAINMMAEQRRTRGAYEIVRHLSNKIWGSGTNLRNEKTAKKIVDDFMNAISVITVACDKGAQLTVPQLTADDAIAVILQLKEAMQALKQLRSNLSRRIR